MSVYFQEEYVIVNGIRYDVLPKTKERFAYCSYSGKEYPEAVEYFAYKVLIEQSISNDEYFSEKGYPKGTNADRP